MNYRERERLRMTNERDRIFKDPGLGLFAGKPREFVLSDAAANLWEGIRDDAIHYFARNSITWWGGVANEPSGHMLSSQVACINHLYFLRQRPDLATAVLRAIDTEVVEAEIVDDGCIEFEFIGTDQYLAERSFSRGINCTSIDAFMIGRTRDCGRRAFLIEWKYTETCAPVDKYIPERAVVYDHLITAANSPFSPNVERELYFEPFYQLMRQTLLACKIVENSDHRCTSYRHIHVVPEDNYKFRGNVTSPKLKLKGATVSEAWSAVLKQPGLYVDTTPAKFMRPAVSEKDTRALVGYLRRRYWPET